MALKDMTSIFQPQKTPVGNGLAGDKGLAELTNAGSDLNIDGTLVPGTALANGKGLVNFQKSASSLNIDGKPKDISDGLAKK